MDPARRVRRSLALIAGTIVAMLALGAWLILAHAATAVTAGFATDFVSLYAAGRLAGTGHGAALYDLQRLAAIESAAAPRLPLTLAYLNPPFFAAALAPLAALPFEAAARLWALLDVVCVAATLALLRRALPGVSARRRALWLGLFALATPMLFQLYDGQFSGILLLGWTAGFLQLRAGREAHAGLAFALLLVKPELVIPVALALAWQRRRRALLALVGASLVAVAWSLVVIGPAHALEYPRFVFANAASPAHGSTLALMFGWNGLIGVATRAVPPLLLTLLTVPLGLAGVAVAVAVAPRGRASDARFALGWTALTAATLLADPNLFLQDLILLGPPVLLLMANAPGRDRAWAGRWAGALWLISALGYVPNLHGANLLAMAEVAVLGWTVWSLARGSSPEVAPPMHASAAHDALMHERAAPAAREPIAAPRARG